MKKILLIALVLIIFSLNVLVGYATYGNTGGTITTDGDYTVHTFSSNANFTPCRNGDVDVICRGGGGSGAGAREPGSGGGGAGGQCALKAVSVTKDTAYACVVGAGGVGDTGEGDGGHDSTFHSTIVVAKGGDWGYYDGGRGGVGTTTGGVGDTVYAGGDGGNGHSTDEGGGGGGEGGCTDKTGGDGVNGGTSGGAGGSGGDGGDGGSGGDDYPGNAGNVPGGGGGGAGSDSSSNYNGGDGGAGQVIIRCLTSAFQLEPDQVTGVLATDGTYTDKVRVTWNTAPLATKYYVWNGASWIDVGNVTTWDDTNAPAPTITHGTITASDGTSTAQVVLANAGESANVGSSISYKVKAWNAAGYGAESDTNTGYRGVGALTYQWQRSDGDADSGYGNIGGATTDPYNDTAAPAGSVPGVPTGLAATDGVHTDKVALTWANVSGGAGAGRYYKCYHTATGAASGYTGVNRGYRGAYTSTNTQAKRDAVELGAIGSLATSYNDTGADAPTITVGTASASDGTSSDYVTLSIAGESTTVGTTHNYYVRTYNAAGWGNYCATNTGYRGVGVLTYQWQRSAIDSDANYSNIDGGTTDPYNDTGAPEDGSGRYFKCIENAAGAAEVTTNADRGNRIAAGIIWNGIVITKWNGITITIPLNTQ